jgi:hypothetical protein
MHPEQAVSTDRTWAGFVTTEALGAGKSRCLGAQQVGTIRV